MSYIIRVINIGLCLKEELIFQENSYLKFYATRKEYDDCIVIDLRRNLEKYHNIEKFEKVRDIEVIYRINQDIFAIRNDGKTGEVFCPFFDSNNVSTFILMMFYSYAVKKRIIQFHSSLLEINGRGLMFLGPSGIGKTTQAELWNKYRNALIINGDIVFVQETEDGFLGWGTPWHGSSSYCENTSVPVKALVVLKQAPENSIRELTGFEKVTAVSNSVFYPRWLENGMELCLETLDHLLSALPVYELSCRPDEEAVRLTEEAVFGRG